MTDGAFGLTNPFIPHETRLEDTLGHTSAKSLKSRTTRRYESSVSKSSQIVKTLKSGNAIRVGVALRKKHSHRSQGFSRTYRSWLSMRDRCTNPAASNFHNYGGRGIRVHPLWLVSFPAFLEHMGPRPEGMTLDRIRVNGHYVPGNVKWSDKSEQQRNRRCCKHKGRVIV